MPASIPLFRSLLAILLLALGAVSCTPVEAPSRPRNSSKKARTTVPQAAFEAKVVGVSDGDTLTVLAEGRQLKVRLNGIDAPEKNQPFGSAAKSVLSDLVFGQEVRIASHGTDRYGRTLADVFAGSIWVNAELVRLGFAWHYVAYSSDPRLSQAEAGARDSRQGLWQDPSPVPPWDWRRKPAG